MKKRLLLFILSTTLLLTSCWSSREINELALAFAIAIDKLDNQFLVTVQVVDPTQIAGQKGSANLQTIMTTFQASGSTLYEALKNMTINSPRQIYLSHLRLLVIGEQVAKEGLGEVIDFAARNNELRTDYFVVVAKNNRAFDILNVTTKLEKNPPLKLFDSIELAEKLSGQANGITTDKFVKRMLKTGHEPILTSVSIIGNEQIGATIKNFESITPSAILTESGLAVFKKDTLLGWLELSDTQSVNFINNEIKKTIINVPCDNGLIALDIYNVKSKITTFVKNNKPIGKVKIRFLADISEVACNINISDQTVIKKIEKSAARKLKKQLTETINTVQDEFRADIFGFGQSLHEQNPKKWRSFEKNWDEYFATMDTNIDVKAQIKYRGTIKDNFFSDEGMTKK